MFYRDWRFIAAMVLTVAQQILLALSTYHIACAGMELASGDLEKILANTTLFFAYALSAFVSSSISTVISTRASNLAWSKYINSLLVKATASMDLVSEKNKRAVVQWLSGEASSTISYACGFYIGVASVALNISLSLLVFYISTGWEISLAIALSLVISLLLVMFLKLNIERSSGGMQTKRLEALLGLELTWNSAAYGSGSMRKKSFSSLRRKIDAYFNEVNQYTVLEQVIACTPIVISTFAIIFIVRYGAVFNLALAGALVALLPRTLQLLGNVHAVSIYMSQFYLVRAKLRNLNDFHEKLDRYSNFFELSFDGLVVNSPASPAPVSLDQLMAKLIGGDISNGRYTITGANGSGKSSFLKLVKSFLDDSILMIPESRFSEHANELSTGQTKLKDIESLINIAPPVLMLDEWDANLDQENLKRIDFAINELSLSSVVIEVRHSKSFSGASGALF